MADKQFIEILKNVQNQCIEMGCDECQFGIDGGDDCALSKVFAELCDYPNRWNIEEIERLLKENEI